MFKSNDSIKFMMAKIFLNMAEFKFEEINEPTIYLPYGKNVKEGAPVREGSIDELYEE